jgi:hypothetical protein
MYFGRRCLIDEIWGHCDGVGICGQDSVLSWIEKVDCIFIGVDMVYVYLWIWKYKNHGYGYGADIGR